MKRLLALLAALCLLTGISFAQPGPMPQPENVILMQRASFTIQYGGPTRAEGRSYNFTPVFFIYPDSKLDKSAAEELLADMDIQAQKECCAYYGIPVLDQFSLQGINEFNYAEYYLPDKLHMNEEGYKKIGPVQADFLAVGK